MVALGARESIRNPGQPKLIEADDHLVVGDDDRHALLAGQLNHLAGGIHVPGDIDVAERNTS